MLDFDNLYQPDDVNSFDLFEQPYAALHYIDPRRLSQHIGGYMSPSTSGSPHTPSHTVAGQLDPHVGLFDTGYGLHQGLDDVLTYRLHGCGASAQDRDDMLFHGLETIGKSQGEQQRLPELHEEQMGSPGDQTFLHAVFDKTLLHENRTIRSNAAVRDEEQQVERSSQLSRRLHTLPSTSSAITSAHQQLHVRSRQSAQFEQEVLQKSPLPRQQPRRASRSRSEARPELLALLEGGDNSLKSMSIGGYIKMTSDRLDPKYRSALKPTILKDAPHGRTPRGRMPALEDPALFEELDSSIQRLPTKGWTSSDLGNNLVRIHAANERSSSLSGELFRLRRRISMVKDQHVHAMQRHSTTRTLHVHPAQLEIHSRTSCFHSDGSNKAANELAANERQVAGLARPHGKTDSQIVTNDNSKRASAALHPGSHFEAAAPPQRYKEYQRIDRFWVRDHHGRSCSGIAAMLVLLGASIALSAHMWPLLAVACYLALQASSKDQHSVASRLARATGNQLFLRHMTSLACM